MLPTIDRADALCVPETSSSKITCVISLSKDARILVITLVSGVCLDFTSETDSVLLMPIVLQLRTAFAQDALIDSDWWMGFASRTALTTVWLKGMRTALSAWAVTWRLFCTVKSTVFCAESSSADAQLSNTHAKSVMWGLSSETTACVTQNNACISFQDSRCVHAALVILTIDWIQPTGSVFCIIVTTQAAMTQQLFQKGSEKPIAQISWLRFSIVLSWRTITVAERARTIVTPMSWYNGISVILQIASLLNSSTARVIATTISITG